MISDVKKQSHDYEKIATSWHESSHIICGLFNYIKISNVSMSPETNEGTTDYLLFDTSNIQDHDLLVIILMQELQTLYGGLSGERIYYKEICGSDKFPMHLRRGSAIDIAMAADLIRKGKLAEPGKHTYLLKKQIQYNASQILKEHWDGVKIVAHTLYKKKKLSFDELKSILTKKTNHNDFWKERFKKIKLLHNEKNIPSEIYIKEAILEDTIYTI